MLEAGFLAHGQPPVDLERQRLTGVEPLQLRRHDPDLDRNQIQVGVALRTPAHLADEAGAVLVAHVAGAATGAPLESLNGLKPGDYVVHLEHGIGIYRGTQTIAVGEREMEVAVLEYEGGDRLNGRLYRIDQIEPYRSAGDGAGERPPPRLDGLGGTRWQRQRDRTVRAVHRLAAELLELYARRSLAAGFAYPPDGRWQHELESSFLYEDTPDQRKATEEVKRDMERPHPMDRLVVGDVGYGKTEVAVRAAKRALRNGAGLPLAAALDVEDAAWRTAAASADRHEGIAAFAQKRRPAWPSSAPASTAAPTSAAPQAPPGVTA